MGARRFVALCRRAGSASTAPASRRRSILLDMAETGGTFYGRAAGKKGGVAYSGVVPGRSEGASPEPMDALAQNRAGQVRAFPGDAVHGFRAEPFRLTRNAKKGAAS